MNASLYGEGITATFEDLESYFADSPPPEDDAEHCVPQRGMRRQPGLDHSLGVAFQHLRLLSPQDCAQTPKRGYVVKGLIAPKDLVLVVGEPGTGKSIACPALGYAVAQGRAAFGHRVRKGKVLYFAVEDPHGMRQRISALSIEHGEADGFFLTEGIANLLPSGSRDRPAITDLVDTVSPVLVIIDTLAAAFRGIRENDADQMALVIALGREIASHGPAVVIAHHPPKGGETGRGSGILGGDVDLELFLSINAEKTSVTCKVQKNRNGPSGRSFSFGIKAIEIGVDEDGDPITAPLPVEGVATPPPKPSLTPTEFRAKEILADLVVAKGKPLPITANFPKLAGVPEAAWREDCDGRRLSSCETKKDRTKVFRRAYLGLLTKRIVAARDELVWLTYQDK